MGWNRRQGNWAIEAQKRRFHWCCMTQGMDKKELSKKRRTCYNSSGLIECSLMGTGILMLHREAGPRAAYVETACNVGYTRGSSRETLCPGLTNCLGQFPSTFMFYCMQCLFRRVIMPIIVLSHISWLIWLNEDRSLSTRRRILRVGWWIIARTLCADL